jgi:transposase-like protein
MEQKDHVARPVYSEELQWHIAKEICQKKINWRDAQVEYGIKSPGSIARWVRRYKKGWVISSQPESITHLKKEDLQSLVTQLKKQLKHSRVQNQVYEAVIKNAEKELNIDIRKKSFTKRSKK